MTTPIDLALVPLETLVEETDKFIVNKNGVPLGMTVTQLRTYLASTDVDLGTTNVSSDPGNALTHSANDQGLYIPAVTMAVQALLDKKLSTEVQTLTPTQKSQALSNLGAASTAQLTSLSTALNTAVGDGLGDPIDIQAIYLAAST